MNGPGSYTDPTELDADGRPALVLVTARGRKYRADLDDRIDAIVELGQRERGGSVDYRAGRAAGLQVGAAALRHRLDLWRVWPDRYDDCGATAVDRYRREAVALQQATARAYAAARSAYRSATERLTPTGPDLPLGRGDVIPDTARAAASLVRGREQVRKLDEAEAVLGLIGADLAATVRATAEQVVAETGRPAELDVNRPGVLVEQVGGYPAPVDPEGRRFVGGPLDGQDGPTDGVAVLVPVAGPDGFAAVIAYELDTDETGRACWAYRPEDGDLGDALRARDGVRLTPVDEPRRYCGGVVAPALPTDLERSAAKVAELCADDGAAGLAEAFEVGRAADRRAAAIGRAGSLARSVVPADAEVDAELVELRGIEVELDARRRGVFGWSDRVECVFDADGGGWYAVEHHVEGERDRYTAGTCPDLAALVALLNAGTAEWGDE